MAIQRRTIVAALILHTTIALPTAQSERVSEGRLIEQLASTRQEDRQKAITLILNEVGPAQRGPALERALIDELNRLNELVTSRREADRAGKLLEDFTAEYHADVIQAVSQSSDPSSIPALAGALGTGRRAEEGLAKFGDQAVSATIAIGRQRVGLITTGTPGDTPPHVVASALALLKRLIEQSQPPLSSKSREQIVLLARERLVGRQESGVIMAACKLAVATRDTTLRQRVQQLVTDRRELNAMGVSDPKLADVVERMARNALEGRQ